MYFITTAVLACSVTKQYKGAPRIPLTVQSQGPCRGGPLAWDHLIGRCARDVLPVMLVEGRGESAGATLLTLTEASPGCEEGRERVDVQGRAQ